MKATYSIISNYYKKAIITRHSFVAIIANSRYKLKALAYLFEANGGVNARDYKLVKNHFQHTFSQYKKRSIGLVKLVRQQVKNDAIDALNSRTLILEPLNQEF
jgi:hypothetical protein